MKFGLERGEEPSEAKALRLNPREKPQPPLSPYARHWLSESPCLLKHAIDEVESPIICLRLPIDWRATLIALLSLSDPGSLDLRNCSIRCQPKVASAVSFINQTSVAHRVPERWYSDKSNLTPKPTPKFAAVVSDSIAQHSEDIRP